jgi:putative FmdB family regulatory protein
LVKKIECPGCGWSSRIIYLSSRNSYQCMDCGHIWERTHKVVKEKLYRCPQCGHEWGEKDVLLSETIKEED